MPVIELSPDQITDAEHVEGWNMSLLGKPKMTVVCGSCSHLFKTRDYIPLDRGEPSKTMAASCPACSKWNRLGIWFA